MALYWASSSAAFQGPTYDFKLKKKKTIQVGSSQPLLEGENGEKTVKKRWEKKMWIPSPPLVSYDNCLYG